MRSNLIAAREVGKAIGMAVGIAVGAIVGLLLPPGGTWVTAAARAAAMVAPAQLYGKSVVISYTGTINARPVGSNEPYRARAFSKQISVYISTAGRLFMRNSSRVARAGSAVLDQVGASGANQSGGSSNVQFQGGSLVIVFAYESGAAHIQADFDAAFTSCTADVIRAKAAGNATRIAKGMVTGRRYEVESSTTSGVSCAIRDGNVFAGE